VPLAPLLARLDLDLLPCGADRAARTDRRRRAVFAWKPSGFGIDALFAWPRTHLPKREAVWWACMCAASVPDPALAQLRMRRRSNVCRGLGAQAGRRCLAPPGMGCCSGDDLSQPPEAWAAVAAFWSGGSMSPVGQPVVPPAEGLTGQAVGGAVMLAAVRGHPQRSAARLTRFLGAARDIAAGGAGRLGIEAA
jgi:hypothetical protein